MQRLTLLAAIVLSPSALAVADVIVFDNTAGQFQWTPELYDGTIPGSGNVYLDITRAPDDQEDIYTTSSAWMVYYPAEATPHWDRLELHGAIALGPLQTFHDEEGDPFNVHFAQQFSAGDMVGSDANYFSPHSQAHLQLFNYYTDPPITESFSDSKFVGMRITLDGNIHYGWIQLELSQDGAIPKPLRWGYETTPGMSALVIPAPATVAIFTLFLPMMTRRRRATH
jgi:hypothetical protein